MVGNQVNHFHQLSAVEKRPSAHNTCLFGDWPDYYKSKRGKKTRHNDRRKRKKLEAIGRLEVLFAGTTDDIDRLVTAMLHQKRDYARNLRKTNVLEQPGYHDFLCERAEAGLDDGTTVLCGIELNGEILAVQWGAVHRRRLYSIVASYDSGSLSNLSPGEILLHELFRWCFENGIETFDFTFGDEPYKQAWCENRMVLYHGLIPATAWGLVPVGTLKSTIKLKHRIRNTGWLWRTYAKTRQQFHRLSRA